MNVTYFGFAFIGGIEGQRSPKSILTQLAILSLIDTKLYPPFKKQFYSGFF